MNTVRTVIIGGSAAGLACAKCLQDQGLDFVILEQSDQIAQKWRNHYDRLHLHTSKDWSELPGKQYARDLPKYPPKQAVVDYLVAYAQENRLQPIFNTTVRQVRRTDEGRRWEVLTDGETYTADTVIMAAGMNHTPKMPKFEGLDGYTGELLHSSEYKNGQPYTGKKVLVVGFGNSGCEQAICLHEHGAYPSISVRSGVNVLPRDILGMPILKASKLTQFLPPKIADWINKPIIHWYIGDLSQYGLKKHPYGPAEQLQKENRVPLLDIGTLKLIKEGHITIYPNIKSIEGKKVAFVDGRVQDFDAIIMATGFHNHVTALVDISDAHLADLKNPIKKQQFFGKDGLYFCGYYLSPNGMLHEIAYEAGVIAKDIGRRSR